MCRGSKGLLTKIVEVMKKEPTASTFRFWLARAVESYLRGSTSFCDQVFLLRKGLLQVCIFQSFQFRSKFTRVCMVYMYILQGVNWPAVTVFH